MYVCNKEKEAMNLKDGRVGVCRVWEGLEGGKGRVIIISKNKKIKEIIITIFNQHRKRSFIS